MGFSWASPQPCRDALTRAVRNALPRQFGGSQAALNGNSCNCSQFGVIGGICQGIPACHSSSFMLPLISTSLRETRNIVVSSSITPGGSVALTLPPDVPSPQEAAAATEEGWVVGTGSPGAHTWGPGPLETQLMPCAKMGLQS